MFDCVIDDEPDRIFKALGDPTRRRIIDRLREHLGQPLFEICARSVAVNGMPISRQTITQHLGTLEEAGLGRIELSCRAKIHSLEPDPLREAINICLPKHQ